MRFNISGIGCSTATNGIYFHMKKRGLHLPGQLHSRLHITLDFIIYIIAHEVL